MSGVQTVPNNLQSTGLFSPRRIAPHSQAGLSWRRMVSMSKTSFGVESGIILRAICSALNRHVAEAAPFEAVAQLEHLGDDSLRLDVPSAVTARIYSFSTSARPSIDLAHQHQDRLHHVERLETGDHHRLAIVFREFPIGLGPDHGARHGPGRRSRRAAPRPPPSDRRPGWREMAAGVST